jgi:hypothetical protein
MITYYLFYYREKKTLEHLTYKFASGTGSGGGYNPDYTSRINGYDLNDLSLERPKHYNSLDFGYTLDTKKIKYLKGINNSLNKIRLLVNKNRETTYNIQNRNPVAIEGNPRPFMFVAKYLTDKMNQLSANLYDVKFVDFNEIIGEEPYYIYELLQLCDEKDRNNLLENTSYLQILSEINNGGIILYKLKIVLI